MSGRRAVPEHEKLRLRAHFGFSKLPFNKNVQARNRHDSRGQRELFRGLNLWAQVHGISLVTGDTGVGKSITIRHFASGLDESRFRVLYLAAVPASPFGFLRAINRVLGLPMRAHASDLFDQARQHLSTGEDRGPHPLLIVDDAEGLSTEVLDLLRRLTTYELDSEDRFSILLTGTNDLLRTLRHPDLAPLCSRISYAVQLQTFSLEDARAYVAFHLRRADAPKDLFSDDAVRQLFMASQGRPRTINQIALGALIQAAVEARDHIDGKAMDAFISAHPLFDGGLS